MKLNRPLMLALLAATASAQNDFFSSLLSDAGSIFSSFTSVIGNTNTASSSSSASATSSSTSSSSTSSSSSANTSSATSSASAAATSSLSTISSTSRSSTSTSTRLSSTSSDSSSASSTRSNTSSSASNAAQSATPSSSASGGGGGSSSTLPIVLGCTLGALALAAFLALLFFCRRRRRRNVNARKHRSISPTDDEISSWRHEKPFIRSSKTPAEQIAPMGAYNSGAPLMSEHSHTGLAHENHQNPFAPVPPPARRSNSRAGLHGPAYYSAQPFSADDYHPHNGDMLSGPDGGVSGHHDNGHAAASGLGGLALGGLAAHAVSSHHRKRSRSSDRKALNGKHGPVFSEVEHNTLPERTHRRSGSVSRASVKEPWPFLDARERTSIESGRSRARSLSRSQEHFATPDQGSLHTPAMPPATKTVGAAALGGLAGAAIARKSGSKSPRRKSILKQTTSDSSNPASISSDSRKSPINPIVTDEKDLANGPHELAASDYPPTPTTRERRNSALGSAAPAAAIGSVVTDASPERPRNRRSGSGGSTTLPMPPPPLTIPTTPNRRSTDITPPVLPNRSPRRRSLTPNARYSSATEGTAEMPAHSVERAAVSPPLDPHRYSDNGGLVSPVSPMIGSHPGSLSRAHGDGAHLSSSTGDVLGRGSKTLSEDSTAVVTPEAVSEGSTEQSSGLVSAIQRIFGNQKAAWTDQDEPESIPSYRRVPEDIGQSETATPLQSIPHRKPAPNRSSFQPNSYENDIAAVPSTSADLPGAWTQSSAEPRHSSEWEQSVPFQRQPQRNSFGRSVPEPPISATVAATARPRAHSRPGYGLGSGDPFDLATMRTDSNMTGISLSNYQTPPAYPQVQPAYQRPAFSNRDSSSSDYRHPTLAELRQQVVEEDKMRAKAQWRRSRSISTGRRHGDDNELFDLANPDHESSPYERERFYGPEQAKKRSLERERSRQGSTSGVGYAY